MALLMRREQKPPAGVRPGSEPAHNSTLIGYTNPRDAIQLFLEEAWQMGGDGKFLNETPHSDGIFIRCNDAVIVEFLRPAPPTAPPPTS